MNTTTAGEFESVTRVIARWGSVVAAIIFGVGFVTDKALSYHLITGQIEQILLVLITFAGYLLAWRSRFEVWGSIVSVAAVAAYWTWCRVQNAGSPNPIILAVAAPALFHLAAVAFHRLRLTLRTRQ